MMKPSVNEKVSDVDKVLLDNISELVGPDFIILYPSDDTNKNTTLLSRGLSDPMIVNLLGECAKGISLRLKADMQ